MRFPPLPNLGPRQREAGRDDRRREIAKSKAPPGPASARHDVNHVTQSTTCEALPRCADVSAAIQTRSRIHARTVPVYEQSTRREQPHSDVTRRGARIGGTCSNDPSSSTAWRGGCCRSFGSSTGRLRCLIWSYLSVTESEEHTRPHLRAQRNVSFQMVAVIGELSGHTGSIAPDPTETLGPAPSRWPTSWLTEHIPRDFAANRGTTATALEGRRGRPRRGGLRRID
jgi:hypothetical protein